MRVNTHDVGIRSSVDRGFASFSAGLGAGAPAPQPAPPRLHVREAAQKSPPPKTSLPATDAPPKQKKPEQRPASELAIAQATRGNAYKLVSSLVDERAKTGGAMTVDGKPTLLATMASAIAASLGIPPEAAAELVHAMSRGGAQATAIATGLATLRGMDASERGQWLTRWLSTARAAAAGVLTLDPQRAMESLGASDDAARAFGDLAGLSFLMANRGVTTLEDGRTVAERAEELRARAEKLASMPQGAEAILADVKQIGLASTPEEKQRRFDALARDLAVRYGASDAMAGALVTAMRTSSQVGRLVAEGLNGLEALDGFKGAFAQSFFWTAAAAANAERTALADPFSSTVGVMSQTEAGPVGALADFNQAMADYKRALDREAKQTAMPQAASA